MINSQRKTAWIKGPDPKTQEILNTALTHVKSVSYKVSLRWVFYRLYQWEALADESASEIIRESLDKFIDREIIKEAETEAHEKEEFWADHVREAIQDIIKEG